MLKVYSSDGDKHYLLFDSDVLEASKNGTLLDIAKIKKILKEDASKPLFVEH